MSTSSFTRAFYALLLGALVACSSDSAEPVRVSSVVIAPETHSLHPGETIALGAIAKDANGAALDGRAFSWRSANVNIASVSDEGVVTAVAEGEVTIYATSEGKEGSASILVLRPVVANVDLDQISVSMPEDALQQLIATPRDLRGQPLSGRPRLWTSSNESAATVSEGGMVTAVAPGITTITVTIEGKSASAAFTITPAAVASVALDASEVALVEGASRKLVATAKSANGKTLAGRLAQWATSDRTIASVSAQGDLTALRGGSAWISATIEGKTATAAVAITANFGFELLYDALTGPQGLPELYALDIRDAAASPRRVLLAGIGTFDIVASPDGKRIAFAAAEGGSTDIYVGNRDGSDLVRLTTTSVNEDQPTWSPDGTKIAFRRWQTLGTPHDIWVMNADGTGQVNLTAENAFQGEEHAPAWSPQLAGGSRIAFVHEVHGQDGYMRAKIYSMKPDGSDKQVVTVNAGDHYDDQPAWSPDGSTIAFVRTGPQHDHSILLVAVGLGTERALMPTDPDGPQRSPAWSPDGSLIAFMSHHEIDEDGYEDQFYTVRPDGTRLTRRTYDAAEKRRVTFVKR